MLLQRDTTVGSTELKFVSRYCLLLLSAPMGLAARQLLTCSGEKLEHLLICICIYCYSIDIFA